MKLTNITSLFISLCGLKVLPISNIFLSLPQLLSLSSISTRKLVYLFISIIAGLFGSFLSEKPIISSIFVLIVCLSYLSFDAYSQKISKNFFLRLLLLASVLNLSVAFIQLFLPGFIIIPHPGDYTITTYSSTAQLIPFWPSIPRVSGLFIENGPMVSSLLTITYFLLSNHNALKIVTRLDKFLFSFIILFNLCLILFTGSKLMLFVLPLSMAYLIQTLMPRIRASDFQLGTIFSRLIPKAFLLFTALFFLSIAAFLNKYHLRNIPFYEYLQLMQSLLHRLLPPDLELFSGIGIGSTTNQTIDALNGFYIYSNAFGIVPGIVFSLSLALFILKSAKDFNYYLLFLITFISSGSFLIYQYPIILLCSRLSSTSSRFIKPSSGF